MQMFTKVQTRQAARSASFGSKVVDNGKDSPKRWGRLVEAKPTKKETLSLTCNKDFRYPEKTKSVQVKVKKSKLVKSGA